MGFFYTVLGILAALDAAVWGLFVRKVARLASWPLRAAFHAFFALQLGGVGLILWSAHVPGMSHRLPVPLLYVVYIWHLLLAPLFLAAGLLGLTGEGVLGVFRAIFRRRRRESEPILENASGISRRHFLGTVAALTPPLLTGSLGVFAATQSGEFRVRRLTLPIPGLPAGLDGMTIAHLSDLHVGQFVSAETLRAVVETTNSLKADLALFTGDLINSDITWLPQAFDTIRAIEPEVFLCEGNHDRGNHRVSFDQSVKAAGFRLLIDETATVTVRGLPVQLLGLRWDGPQNWQNRGDERRLRGSVEALLAQRDPGAFPILLAHHPHAWDYCGELPLTLSGHTHGGQFMLNEEQGFGPAMFRYWTGVYTKPMGPGLPDKTLVVSNGVGNWFPLRINAPAEILHLTLRRA